MKFTIINRKKTYLRICGHKDKCCICDGACFDTVSEAIKAVFDYCHYNGVNTGKITIRKV